MTTFSLGGIGAIDPDDRHPKHFNCRCTMPEFRLVSPPVYLVEVWCKQDCCFAFVSPSYGQVTMRPQDGRAFVGVEVALAARDLVASYTGNKRRVRVVDVVDASMHQLRRDN